MVDDRWVNDNVWELMMGEKMIDDRQVIDIGWVIDNA